MATSTSSFHISQPHSIADQAASPWVSLKVGYCKIDGESMLIIFRKMGHVFGKAKFWTPKNVVNQVMNQAHFMFWDGIEYVYIYILLLYQTCFPGSYHINEVSASLPMPHMSSQRIIKLKDSLCVWFVLDGLPVV